ncbi:MAG: PEGA domain-containing protein [Kiritimatiellaeota bacterium]|nr:PEGA domain-containing protein [Kiritimatiellota bacterium]
MRKNVELGNLQPLFLGAVVLAALVVGGCGRSEMIVRTRPPGATVWVNGELKGPAPCRVRFPRQGIVRLRVSHPGYHEWSKELRADSARRQNVLEVALKPRVPHKLVCTTRPPGAKVLLDGQFRGLTPLTIENVDLESCTLVFRLAGFESVSRPVDLRNAPEQVRVDVTLRGLTEAYYLTRIKKAPDDLGNYVDLAHGYALDKKFKEAAAAIENAVVRIYEHGAAKDANRLWSEADRIITRQFAYGDERDVAEARRQLGGVLKRLLKKYGARSPELYRTYIVLLAADGEKARARVLYREALRRFPGDRHLRRLAKHLRL